MLREVTINCFCSHERGTTLSAIIVWYILLCDFMQLHESCRLLEANWVLSSTTIVVEGIRMSAPFYLLDGR